jgi:flagellar L-ring protein precursor FlgH
MRSRTERTDLINDSLGGKKAKGRIARTAWIILAITSVALVQGCATRSKKEMPEAMTENQGPIISHAAYQPPSPEEGSLWQENVSMLFTDAKARKIGDTVTIDIVEVTSSKMDANTTTGRTSSIDAGVENALGYLRALEERNNRLGKDSAGAQTSSLIKAGSTNSFSGKGSSDRSGSITASIGARVVEVLPNGNLVLFGRREMKVNNEVQFITASGVVRPEDIGSDNRVKSTYIADAHIEYIGRGVIAQEQKPGWGVRLIERIWPF